MLKERWKKWGTAGRKKMIFLLAGCLILAGVSLTVYSKYYKTGYEKGMAIASGFYFSSNYMYEEEGLEDIGAVEELLKEENRELVNKLIVAVSNAPWSNGEKYTFHIDMRNYANQLLYNDKDLDVSYTIDFILLDKSEGMGGIYSVRKGRDGSYIQLKNDGKGGITKASFQGTLEGGKLSVEDYELQISLNGTVKAYTPARVLVMAYPTEPSFLQDTKKIAGIIRADYNQAEMEITEQKFTVEEKLEQAGSGWKEQAMKESAFVYQLRTTGGYFVEGNDNMMQRIKLTWNPDIFMLNQNDRYLNQAEGTKLVEYDKEKGIMVIETVPYSSIKFVFFKANSFKDGVTKMGTLEDFKKTIKAEKVE